jgi:hypothetical protein
VEAPVERTFSQTEVNALLAREAGKLKRKLKKTNQQANVEPQPMAQPSGEETATMQALNKILGRLENLETDNAQKSKEESFNLLVGRSDVDESVRGLLFNAYDPARPEATSAMLEKLAPLSVSQGTGYESPGAPSQSKETIRGVNPMAWSKDDVDVLRQEGRFIESLEKWRSTLPGGGGNLFANRNNKRKK